ncbi:MAG: polyphosphate kinase 2 family protein [Anaerolineae bacterium]|nr:polyphosphate kinase 2 family protein [Anaerolineae bacterium]
MNDIDLSTHRIAPKQPVDLEAIPTDGKDYHEDRDMAEIEFKALCEELAKWQQRLYAEGQRKLLIVLQAMDAGGKDSTIRHLFGETNPQGVRVHSFKVPSKEELAHDFLWRVHKRVPENGMIGVFNRSHYEDVVVVRVDKLVPEDIWSKRYEQINQFEKLLTETGTTILKLYLHISKEEQRKQFQERLDDPEKNWKFSFGDLEKRKQWNDYMVAYGDAIARCTTESAPWYIIPADQKWYRLLAVARIVVGTLRQMNPAYPPPEGDLSGVVVD